MEAERRETVRAAIIERNDSARLCLEQDQRLAEDGAGQRLLTDFLRLGGDVPGVVDVHYEVLSLHVISNVDPTELEPVALERS